MESGTTLFGKYLLFERICSGGKAEIWRAARQGGDGFVVVKRLRPSLAKDPGLQAMFIQEAKIAVQLSHPNIARVFDLGLVNDDFYIELEYLPGADLRTLLPRCEGPGVVPFALAGFMAAELCDALDHLHRKLGPTGAPLQLVHREISPENVVVTFDGRVKLIDFSAATGHAPVGVSPYLCPEQMHGLPLDRRADVFSVSVLLYEALTGRRLYSSPTAPNSKELHCCRPVLQPRAVNPKIPADLERIVLAGLEHDRARRYQWASEMSTALRGFLVRLPDPPSHATLRDFMHRTFAAEVAQEAVRLKELHSRMPAAERHPRHGEGFDFDIDESLMQQVVTAEDDLPEMTEPRYASPTILVQLPPLPELKVSAPAPQPAAPATPAAPVPAADGDEEPGASKRKAKRWKIVVPVKGIWGPSGGRLSNHFSANLVNLSTTGAMLRLDEASEMPVGAAIGFTLPLRLRNMIALEGVVRRVRKVDRGREIGVEFVTPHPELLKLHQVK